MTVDDDSRNPVEILAEQFLRRVRGGESVTVEDYAREHPEISAEIRAVFPTMMAMEGLKQAKVHSSSGGRRVQAPVGLQRLGDFRIVREIGRGGMGIVYEAEQESLGRHVAVKVLPRHSLLDEQQLARFHREAQTAGRLHHSNIVPVFGVGDQDGLHYYVMQLIRGTGLDSVLRELRRRRDHSVKPTGPDAVSTLVSSMLTGTLASRRVTRVSEQSTDSSAPFSDFRESAPQRADTAEPEADAVDTAVLAGELGRSYWKSVATIGAQVAEALLYAHGQGILHRDIKPANLLVDASGVVWLADFGIAKALENDGLTQAGDILGTLHYMAPEQMRGQQDARSDVYSLGLTLYELVTLDKAFQASTPEELMQLVKTADPVLPRRINPKIPRDLETIIMKAIAREPDDRYASAGELARDLNRFLDDRPIFARRASATEQLWRWCRRNRMTASLAAVALALVVTTAIVSSTAWLKTEAALGRESQRKQEALAATARAEANLDLALEAFEDIFERVAGRDDFEPLVEDSEELEFESQPVITAKDAQLLERLIAFLDRFAETNLDNEKLVTNTAWAYRRVGEIHLRLQDQDRAATAFARGLAIVRSVERPNDDLLIESAMFENELALLASRFDDFKAGHDRAVRILTHELAEPQSARARYELVRVQVSVPVMMGRRGMRGPRRGDQIRSREAYDRLFEEVERGYRQALELSLALHGEDPTNPAYRLTLAQSHLALAQVMVRRDPEQRRKSIEDGIAVLEALTRDRPEVAEYRHTLARALIETSRAGPRGERAEHAAHLERARELCETLVDEQPAIPSYAFTLADVTRMLASTLRDSEPARSVTLAERAHELYVDLAQRLPDNFMARMRSAQATRTLAVALARAGRGGEALALLNAKWKAISEEAVKQEPSERRGFDPRFEVLGALAEVHGQLGNESEAAAFDEQVKELRKQRGRPGRGGRGERPRGGDRPDQ